MRIERPAPEPYEVEDFAFTFANGITFPVQLIRNFGDVVDWDTSPMAVKFNLAGRPLPSDPAVKSSPEEFTVMMQHVILIEKRTRIVTPPTFEEQDLFKQALLQAPKTVQ